MRGFRLPWIGSLWHHDQVRTRRGAVSCRPRLEPLESRWVPASGGTPNQNFVQQLYQDVLHRTADTAGLTFWTNELNSGALTQTQVAFGVEASQEGRQQLVNDLYLRLLRRPADSTGLADWTGFLGQGNTTTDLEAQLLASNEYFTSRGGGTVQGWITAVYQDVLGRAPDTGGLAGWTQALSGGASHQQVALGILQSTEGRNDQVLEYYRSYLRRTGDTSGVNYWADLIERDRLPDEDLGDVPLGNSSNGNNDNNSNGNNTNVTNNLDMALAAEFLGSQEYFQDAQSTEVPATIPGVATAGGFGGITVGLRS
jgi:hypothetical protein